MDNARVQKIIQYSIQLTSRNSEENDWQNEILKLNSIVMQYALPLLHNTKALQVHSYKCFISFNLAQGYLQMQV